MSRKTKEEKKLAQLRKQTKLLQQIDISTPSLDSPIKQVESGNPTSSDFIKTASDAVEIKPEDLSRKNYFIQDLKRSLLIIAGIITLEILIYFATINK